MSKCPACQTEIDETSLAAGQCGKCGATLRNLPHRTIEETTQTTELPPAQPSPQESLETLIPGEQTIAIGEGEPTVIEPKKDSLVPQEDDDSGQPPEKPAPEKAPSNLAVVGRYLLDGDIFNKLENTGRGAGGEIQLTDAIADLLGYETVESHRFAGTRYDCGSKLGYVRATLDAAREDPEIIAALQGDALS